MVRRDGYVKVLDFGLAKLSEPEATLTGSDPEASTRALVNTDAGTVMGTAASMIVIGGLGSISGSILGAVLFITLTEGLRQFAQYRMVLFSLLLIIIMIVRPQGILGHREFVTFLTRKRRPLGESPGTPESV